MDRAAVFALIVEASIAAMPVMVYCEGSLPRFGSG